VNRIETPKDGRIDQAGCVEDVCAYFYEADASKSRDRALHGGGVEMANGPARFGPKER